jgi:rod shape-determining protein MreD
VTLTPGTFVRTGLLLVLVVVLQIATISPLHLLGGNADVIVLLVAAIGLYAGSVSGAVVGFCAGLLLDVSLGQTLGATSLILTVLGYFVGRFSEVRDPAHGLIPLPVGLFASMGYVLATAALQFMLDVGADVSVLALREMIATVLLNTIIALPVFAAIRRVVRPVLTYDPMERHRSRRAETTPAGPIGLRGLDVRKSNLPR